MFTKSIFFCFLVFAFLQSDASHIFGGVLHYRDLENNVYEVDRTLYWDLRSNAKCDVPVSIGCFDYLRRLVHKHERGFAYAIVTSFDEISYNGCYSAQIGLSSQRGNFMRLYFFLFPEAIHKPINLAKEIFQKNMCLQESRDELLKPSEP